MSIFMFDKHIQNTCLKTLTLALNLILARYSWVFKLNNFVENVPLTHDNIIKNGCSGLKIKYGFVKINTKIPFLRKWYKIT